MTDPSRPVVRVVRRLPASREEVFDAWLDAESLQEWMCPGATRKTVAEVDARVGGRFRIVMTGEHGDTEHTGEYREIRRPDRLVFTWISTFPIPVGTTTDPRASSAPSNIAPAGVR